MSGERQPLGAQGRRALVLACLSLIALLAGEAYLQFTGVFHHHSFWFDQCLQYLLEVMSILGLSAACIYAYSDSGKSKKRKATKKRKSRSRRTLPGHFRSSTEITFQIWGPPPEEEVTDERLSALSGTRTNSRARFAEIVTDVAVFLAGRRRTVLREEWSAHLAGEKGIGLTSRRKIMTAIGFIVAAMRFRAEDVADLAWIPVDAVLKSRKLSNLFIGAPPLVASMIVFCHGGLYAMLTSAESIIAIGGLLLVTVHAGRRWRGVKPAKHKPRRERE
jgi:hypothetical protein